MALLLPLGVCLLAAVIACLPAADVRPVEGASWLPTGLATVVVLAVCAFTVAQLRENDRAQAFASRR